MEDIKEFVVFVLKSILISWTWGSGAFSFIETACTITVIYCRLHKAKTVELEQLEDRVMKGALYVLFATFLVSAFWIAPFLQVKEAKRKESQRPAAIEVTVKSTDEDAQKRIAKLESALDPKNIPLISVTAIASLSATTRPNFTNSIEQSGIGRFGPQGIFPQVSMRNVGNDGEDHGKLLALECVGGMWFGDSENTSIVIHFSHYRMTPAISFTDVKTLADLNSLNWVRIALGNNLSNLNVLGGA